MKGLAGGDLNVSVPALSRDDEVGAMARAVQVFKENAQRVLSMEAEQASLKIKAEADRKAAMQQMAGGFDSAIGKIIQPYRPPPPNSNHRRTTDQDRRSDPDAVGYGCRRLGAVLGKRAVRGCGGGRDDFIGVGDQPPGPGFAQDFA